MFQLKLNCPSDGLYKSKTWSATSRTAQYVCVYIYIPVLYIIIVICTYSFFLKHNVVCGQCADLERNLETENKTNKLDTGGN